MKKKLPKAVLFFCLIFSSFFFSTACAGRNNAVAFIVPDQESRARQARIIETDDIIETQDGYAGLPDWLSAFIYGGIEEVEKMNIDQNKYFFISRNEGANINALNKWANNYSSVQDFKRLVSARIEERMIYAAGSYPDNEYGNFFEALVKKALGAEYPGSEKEDTYWIKTRNIQENEYKEVYEFFVVLSIDKTELQNIIRNMMAEVLGAVRTTRAQNAAIARLQLVFFEGF